MPVWVAPVQVINNMVYALERQLQPMAKFAGRHLATGQHLQSPLLQSARRHMALSILPMAVSAQQAEQGMDQHAAHQGLGLASEMRFQTETGVKLPEKGRQQQQQQSGLEQSRLQQV